MDKMFNWKCGLIFLILVTVFLETYWRKKYPFHSHQVGKNIKLIKLGVGEDEELWGTTVGTTIPHHSGEASGYYIWSCNTTSKFPST